MNYYRLNAQYYAVIANNRQKSTGHHRQALTLDESFQFSLHQVYHSQTQLRSPVYLAGEDNLYCNYVKTDV